MSDAKYIPPVQVRRAAARGLDLVRKGKAGGGFQPATATRARKIAAGKPLTLAHVKRMNSFFSRHAGGRSKTAPSEKTTPWDVAWQAWGGNAGKTWSNKIVNQNKD